MKKKEILEMLNGIISERGVPRNIKTSIEESMMLLNNSGHEEEKIANIVFVLDEASNDPNVLTHTRTQIWNAISFLESMKKHD